jgi:hypothetical protein
MKEKICRSFFHKDIPSPNPQQVRQWDVDTNYKVFYFKVKYKTILFLYKLFSLLKNYLLICDSGAR